MRQISFAVLLSPATTMSSSFLRSFTNLFSSSSFPLTFPLTLTQTVESPEKQPPYFLKDEFTKFDSKTASLEIRLCG
jgi:hypothetical protein